MTVVSGVPTAGPPAPGAALETVKSKLCGTSRLYAALVWILVGPLTMVTPSILKLKPVGSTDASCALRV